MHISDLISPISDARDILVATARAAQTVLLFTMLQKQTLASQRSLHIAAVEARARSLPYSPSGQRANSEPSAARTRRLSLAQRELAV